MTTRIEIDLGTAQDLIDAAFEAGHEGADAVDRAEECRHCRICDSVELLREKLRKAQRQIVREQAAP